MDPIKYYEQQQLFKDMSYSEIKKYYDKYTKDLNSKCSFEERFISELIIEDD